MKSHKTRLAAALLILPLVLGLTACSSKKSNSPGFVMIDESAAETETAQTAWAKSNPSPTPGPVFTPVPTGTAYAMPTPAPGYNGSLVITRVGNEDLTLADYQKHVRFDRYRYLYGLAKLVEKYGAAKILDLTKSENEYVSSLLATLADSYSFGTQSHRLMVIERIVTQEALRRGLEVDPHIFDAKAAEYLGLIVGEGGKLPPEYDQRYPEFIKGLQTYAGMSEEEFRKIVRARALYEQLQFIISNEPGAIPQDQREVGVQVQDAIIPGQAQAKQIANRLLVGEALPDILTSLGYTTQSGAMHTVRKSDASLTDEIKNVVFAAKAGDVIGPLPVSGGWYVGKIGQQMLDILSPQEIDTLRQQHFAAWIESKMDDPQVVQDDQNWVDDTPQDPLPQDVSPLLRDENFILPKSQLQGQAEGTPSPVPVLTLAP